ncbi:alpha/beta fold hydrolase [Reyranella sp.]|uniref:alpha/beta fold hydrolase n=1 Tax=Reyranella sp. TaxID=1929291 RepID=UPI003D0EA443
MNNLLPMDPILTAFNQAQFEFGDLCRRFQGYAFEALGLGPNESSYRIAASGTFWRLRDYGGQTGGPSVLIIAAPIKRPYIWDLCPSVSVIRLCMQHGVRVHLLDWLPATPATGNNGLREHMDAIRRCVGEIADEIGNAKPYLFGHSLGGTLAAMFGALASDAIRGIALLGAPLCFKPAASRFRDSLVSLVPSGLPDAIPCPGSLLSSVSALASPETFIWSRFADAAFSLADGHGLEIHGRVERWALDEAPLPGRLAHQLVDWLYREDRFCRGVLAIGGRSLGPQSVAAPMLAIVNTADDVAPRGSIEPFVEAMGTSDARIVEYPGETGVSLQHLGLLIGQAARAQVWPKILSWMSARA